MPNVLVENEPRIGWYYDNLPDEVTPATATMLLDDGERITLTIPWQGMDGDSGQLSRWFHGDSVSWGDDPDRTKFSYDLPTELGFYDADGLVTLVGCRVAGYHGSLGRAARGVAAAQFAVLGASDLRWAKINAVRTAIPELSEWARLSAMQESRAADERGRITRYNLSLEATPDLRLDRRLNLSIVSGWRVSHGARGEPHQVHDDLFIQTEVARERDWPTHLDAHRAVADLLEVAAWRPIGISAVKARRNADPARTMDGRVVEPRWLDVRTYALRGPNAALVSRRPTFLFDYADIGRVGVSRWLRLRKRFSRGVMPIVGLHNVERLYIETQLTQSCVGLEAIGYEVAQEQGKTAQQANALNFAQRAELIRQEIGLDILPSDWPSRSAAAYNGFKHANRTLPDAESMFRAHLENILAFRLWVARRLGVSRTQLRGRLVVDDLAQRVRLFQP